MKKPIDEGSRSMKRLNRLINLIELFDRLKNSIDEKIRSKYWIDGKNPIEILDRWKNSIIGLFYFDEIFQVKFLPIKCAIFR